MRTTTILLTALALVISISVSAFGSEQASKEECIKKTEEAAALISKAGKEEALKQINDPNGPFVWKDSYVFAFEIDSCVLIGHPVKPALIGKSLIGMRDFNGKLFFVDLIDIAKSTEGKGWVQYMWPKPGEDKPYPKASYAYRVAGTNVAVSAGVYE